MARTINTTTGTTTIKIEGDVNMRNLTAMEIAMEDARKAEVRRIEEARKAELRAEKNAADLVIAMEEEAKKVIARAYKLKGDERAERKSIKAILRKDYGIACNLVSLEKLRARLDRAVIEKVEQEKARAIYYALHYVKRSLGLKSKALKLEKAEAEEKAESDRRKAKSEAIAMVNAKLAREEEAKAELGREIVSGHNRNTAALTRFKKVSKIKETVGIYQLCLDVPTKDEVNEDIALIAANNKASAKNLPTLERKIGNGLIATCNIQITQESAVSRACNVTKEKMADSKMFFEALAARELIAIKVGTDFRNSLSGDDENSAKMKKKFELLIQDIQDGNVAVAYSASGKATSLIGGHKIRTALKNRKDDVTIIQYSSFLVSASGYASGSAVLAAVKKNGVPCDRRFDILDKSLCGAASRTFTQKFYDELSQPKNRLKMFKQLGRTALGLAPQGVSCEIKSYFEFDNFGFNKFANAAGRVILKGKDVTDAKDGLSFILKDIVEGAGDCMNFQMRGESHKCSALTMGRKQISSLAKLLLEMGVILRTVVVNGKVMSGEHFLSLPESDRLEIIKNTELLTDTNARKLQTGNDAVGAFSVGMEFTATMLKVAKDIESGMSTVIALSMLAVDGDETLKILKKLSMETLSRKLETIGMQLELNEDGEIVEIVEMENNTNPNSSSLTAEYFLGLNREKVLEIMPMSLTGVIANMLEGIKNTANELKFDCDARYSVIQADPSHLFGEVILEEDEVFNRNFNCKKVSGARHPISTTKSVTTFKVVDLKEILARISKLDVSDEVKELIAYFYKNATGFTIIPASKYLMEKHDGADFDIDAFVFYLNQEIVNVLAKIPNTGVIVNRRNYKAATTTEPEVKCTRDHEEMPEEALISKAQTLKYLDMLNADRFHIPKTLKVKEEEVMADIVEAVGRARNGGAAFAGAYKANKIVNSNVVSKDVKVSIFRDVMNTFKDYLLSSVATVGEIATGFYNNVLLLDILKYSENETEVNAIVDLFELYYETSASGKAYTTPFERAESEDGKKTIIEIDKLLAVECVVRYANSKGTKEELVQYLEDCCDISRFPAETSIDSTKNLFEIADLFNHTRVVKALGSDKSKQIVLLDKAKSNEVFKLIVESEGTLDLIGVTAENAPKNMFGAKLLGEDLKGNVDFLAEGYDNIEDFIMNADGIAGFNDRLSTFKQELVASYNLVLIVTLGRIEAKVMADKAREARDSVRDVLSAPEYKSAIEVYSKVVKNITTLGMSTRTSLESQREIEVGTDNKTSKEFEKVAAKAMRNDALFASKKVTVNKKGETVISKDFNDVERGAAVMSIILDDMYACDRINHSGDEVKLPRAINSTMLKVYESDITAFLSTLDFEGADMFGTNFEKIEEIKDASGEYVNMDTVNGLDVVDGQIVELGHILKAYNSKVELNGSIVEIDGLHYVTSVRDSIKEDVNAGLILPIRRVVQSDVANHIKTEMRKNAILGNKTMDAKTATIVASRAPIYSQLAMLTGEMPNSFDRLTIEKGFMNTDEKANAKAKAEKVAPRKAGSGYSLSASTSLGNVPMFVLDYVGGKLANNLIEAGFNPSVESTTIIGRVELNEATKEHEAINGLAYFYGDDVVEMLTRCEIEEVEEVIEEDFFGFEDYTTETAMNSEEQDILGDIMDQDWDTV